MTNEREIMPPPVFSTLPHIPNVNTNERPPVTTTVFAATTPGNTPLAYRASTSTDDTPMISPAFIETNYEILESLLRDRRRQMEVTPPLRTRLPRVRRQRERVVGFEESPNMEGSRTGRITEGNRHSEAGEEENGRREMNLPPLLAAHLGRNENGQPLRSSLTSVHGGLQSLINTGGNLPPNGNPSIDGTSAYPPQGGQIMPDGLKMPSHVGSYDGKEDPDNFLHLFEGAIRMQKWLMPVACHMFTYTLKDSARIWWNSQKAVHSIKQREGKSVRAFATRYTDDTLQILGLHEDQQISGFVHGLRTRNFVEHLSTDLPSTYKGLMEKTYTWIEAREVSTNGSPNDRRDNFERSRKSSWDNGRGQKSRDRFSPSWGPNHGLLSNLSKSPREILAIEKVARSFEQPPRMLGSRRSRDMSKYCYFHEDHGHDTNDCRQLRIQIEVAVKSDQLSHLVNEIKKERVKTSDSQQREKKEKNTTPAEAPILMINQEEAYTRNSTPKSPTFEGREITFPLVTKGCNS
ncbi:hypothetical protein Tco_0181019 [Tanacetum coccineum]